MKKVNLIIIILLSTLFSCKVHCPPFPENLMTYYPYKKGDIIKFKNQDNDTLLLYIDEIEKSEETSFSSRCDCACLIKGGFNGHIENNNDSIVMAAISSFISISNSTYRIEFIPGSSLFSLYYSTEVTELIKDVNRIARYIPNIVNFEYNPGIDSLHFEYVRITKVKIEKDKGITEFYDRKSDCLWVKIE